MARVPGLQEQPALTGWRHLLMACLAAALLAGCSSMGGNKVEPTKIRYAQHEIPEQQLLDLGIVLFEPGEVDDQDETFDPEIRRAEVRYLPFQLKSTLQPTGYWGSVAVIPNDAVITDVYVFGTILESNGEELVIDLRVADITGREWFRRRYASVVDLERYPRARRERTDPHQDLYNRVGNDLLAYRERLAPDQLIEIHRIARMRFAGKLAPDAFGDYVERDRRGLLQLARLPSEDDPMMQRVAQIRDRDLMLVDTLNAYYSDFHDEMREPYFAWREASLQEMEARAELRQKAWTRRLLGVAAFAAAIANEAYGGQSTSHTATALLAFGGVKALEAGQEYADSATIHTAAIEELSDSFAAEISPAVVEVEGHRVRLTGSAEQQYREWQDMMRALYRAETGFDPATPDASPHAIDRSDAGNRP
jgi:hypothetical protein